MSATDAARAILADPRAPAAERFDAQQELERQHRPTSVSDLIPKAAFLPVLQGLQDGSFAEELDLLKASPLQPRGRRGKAEPGMRGMRLDEQQVAVGGDYYEKPGAIDFAGLRQMVNNTPILAAVIGTRIRQMSRFCTPSEDGGLGFSIRHTDKEHEATDQEKEQMKLLTKFFQHGGWEFDARRRKRLRRDTFPTFMAKLLRDSLTFDAAPFETEFTRDKSGIDGLYAVDGATIRLCVEDGYEGDDEIFALQVVSGKVNTTYNLNQLVYEVRNPRTDVTLTGYGFGETEVLIRTVTSMLNAVSYNSDYFDKNSIPKGLLQVFGDYSNEDISSFRRIWRQMVAGVENRYGLPVMVSKDKESGATYTPFNANADEMAFSKWIVFLTSVTCAVFNIDPSEIGFETFSANKSTMSGDDTAEKLAAGRDKGFRPIASHFESVFTDFVVTTFNPDFCFRFEGLEEEDKDRAWEAKKLVCTVDEIRAEEGYKPMADRKIGALPVNPALITASTQLNAPPEQGDDFGADPVQQQGQDGQQDFGADPAQQPEQGGDQDFGADPKQPEPAGDDFGADAPEDKLGKALRSSTRWGFARFLQWRS